ncbi:MAG: SRPBCC family protein [Allosphingosinicella sp.]
MTDAPPEPPPDLRSERRRLAGALGAALLLALAAYFLVESTLGRDGGSGAVTLTFLLAVPAGLSAFVALLGDLRGTKGLGHYLTVPFALTLLAILAGAVFLREGVICILMLAPFWLVGGLIGSLAVGALRKQLRGRGRMHASAALLLPLLAAQVEASLPVPEGRYEVRREVVIAAPPERVWPLLASIPAVRAEEGRWNVAQDLLGIPRPTGAKLVRRGGDLVREAQWGPQIRFEEAISAVRPGAALEWRFHFPDGSVREHTDRHIAPDGAHLGIETGAYRLAPLPGGRTRLTLETRYRLRSPVNGYAAWWGGLLLGGIQDNVLAIVRDRAEAGARGGPAA